MRGCLTFWPRELFAAESLRALPGVLGKGVKKEVTDSPTLSSYFRLPVRRRFTHSSWETFIASG